jgi:hypothetical protein
MNHRSEMWMTQMAHDAVGDATGAPASAVTCCTIGAPILVRIRRCAGVRARPTSPASAARPKPERVRQKPGAFRQAFAAASILLPSINRSTATPAGSPSLLSAATATSAGAHPAHDSRRALRRVTRRRSHDSHMGPSISDVSPHRAPWRAVTQLLL